MFCPNCGSKLIERAEFCSECGKRIIQKVERQEKWEVQKEKIVVPVQEVESDVISNESISSQELAELRDMIAKQNKEIERLSNMMNKMLEKEKRYNNVYKTLTHISGTE